MAPTMHVAETPYTDDEIAMMSAMLDMVAEPLKERVPPQFVALLERIQRDNREAREEMQREAAREALFGLIESIGRAKARR